MKTLLFLLTTVFLLSCSNMNTNKIYEIQVVYFNGQVDTLRLAGHGDNLFSLNQGDLQHLRGVEGNHEIVASGVRKFRVFRIKLTMDSVEFKNTKQLSF